MQHPFNYPIPRGNEVDWSILGHLMGYGVDYGEKVGLLDAEKSKCVSITPTKLAGDVKTRTS